MIFAPERGSFGNFVLELNKIAGFSLRAKIETRLDAKSWQRGPGLVAIVINNPLGEDQGCAEAIDTGG